MVSKFGLVRRPVRGGNLGGWAGLGWAGPTPGRAVIGPDQIWPDFQANKIAA